MKKIITLMMIFLMVGVVSAIDYETDTMNYWKFNGDFTDDSGNFDLGNLSFGSAQFVDGILGQAVYEDVYGVGNTDSIFNTTGLKTIDTWLYVNESSGQEIFITFQNSEEFTFEAQQDTTTVFDYTWTIGTDTGSCQFDTGSYPQITLVDGAFNHFVFVLDGTNAVMYINGVEILNELCTSDFTYDDTNPELYYVIDNMILLNEAYVLADVTASYNSGNGLDFTAPEVVVEEDTSFTGVHTPTGGSVKHIVKPVLIEEETKDDKPSEQTQIKSIEGYINKFINWIGGLFK